MRPDDFGARIVRCEAAERGDIGVQPRRIRRRLERRGQRHILRHGFGVQHDGHVVRGGDIREQQHQRMIGGSVLIGGRAGRRKMFGGNFAEADHAELHQLLGARLELAPHLGTDVAGGHRLLQHGVERASAADHGYLVGMLLGDGQQRFGVVIFRIVGGVGRHQHEDFLHAFAANGGEHGLHARGAAVVQMHVAVDVGRLGLGRFLRSSLRRCTACASRAKSTRRRKPPGKTRRFGVETDL